MSEQPTLVISFSGGRTSAFMTKFLIERYPEKNLVVVFANTGKEREETLQFINQCDINWNLNVVWLEAVISSEFGIGTRHRIVSFETASRNGEPFESMISKYGIPNQNSKHCTRELKNRPIHSYLKSLGLKTYQTAVGIRADEPHRLNFKKAEKENWIYPLATEIKVDEKFIRDWWSRQPFDLQLKDYEGNCDMCWKKSIRKLLTLINEKPELIEWWNKMERNHSSYQTPAMSANAFEPPFNFYRGNKSASQLIELSKSFSNSVKDKYELSKKQTALFDYELDYEEACLCKSN